MSKSYIPDQEFKKVKWLMNFVNKIPTYSTKYAISADDIADMQAGAKAYSYWITAASQIHSYSKKLNSFKRALANGASGTNSLPVAPILTTPPALPDNGIFRRVSAIITVIKSKSAYTQDDGLDLGIVITVPAASDLTTLKPKISARIVTAGHPEIRWTKGNNDAIEIHVDKGDGIWKFSGINLKPNYTNTSTLPPLGKSEVWRYRAIYISDDKHIGQWSDTVVIAVIGLV